MRFLDRPTNLRALIALLSLLFITPSHAAHKTVNLIVEYKNVHFAGKSKKAITVNSQIPAPTLHFKQGDRVRINVYNHLDKDTAIHWHGLILPWQMDGVSGITQKGIKPGAVFHYEFTLEQSGTYWYHAHAGLQEQQGLYGAFLIDPPKAPVYQYNKDAVVVLSDWSNTYPEQIVANLHKEGSYYAPMFPLQASLLKFIQDYRHASSSERSSIVDDYKMMQKMRMSIYDFSDVAYDAYLLNGQANPKPWTSRVQVGDIVRLRFIGAAGSTIYNVKIPRTSMQMVHIDGNDVAPYMVDEFKIAPGETYDVLVKIKQNKPYIIYAQSIDTLGTAYGALITEPNQPVNYKRVTPFPEPKPVMRKMMSLMMKHSMHMGSMKMNMEMPTEASSVGDALTVYKGAPSKTFGTKYQNLKAAVPTNDPKKPISKVIKMELFGYMDRYIWFINGVPEHKAQPIPLKPNKRYRFVFTNPSMMRHPMHIHGHWFILRNGHGRYDPLLHTLDIPPGATVTADLDTDASGQWLFHCHLLYHMMSGMARVFQYNTLLEIVHDQRAPEHLIKKTPFINRPIVRVDKEPIDMSLIHHPMPHAMGFYNANFIEAGADPIHNTQKLTFKGLYGHDYNKLQLYTNDAELNKGSIQNADIDIFYWHLISQFFAVKGGVNYFNRPADHAYWQPGVGIEGVMPYFIDTDIRSYYYKNSIKLDAQLSRDTQLTNNFLIKTGIRSILATNTVITAQLGSGLNQMRYIARPYYRLIPGLSVFVEYEHEHDYGAFKEMQLNNNESTSQDTLTLGLDLLF